MDGRIRIAEWVFEPQLHQLRRDGVEINLEPKQAAVLEALARRAGEAVTREELLSRVWGEIHVTEEVLTNAIYQLRKVLGDQARRPRYIQTISRRGYRLIARVEPAGSSALPPREQTRRSRPVVAAVVAALLVAFPLAFAVLDSGREGRVAAVLREEARSELSAATEGSAMRAADLYDRALAIDPADAAALAGRSLARLALVSDGAMSRAIGHPLAERDAQRALELDPTLADAFVALGSLRTTQWEWEAAEEYFLRAIEIDPQAAETHAVLAELLLLTGRREEARSRIASALRLAPDSPRVLLSAGLIHTMLRDPEAASAAYRALLRRDPGHAHARAQLDKLAAGPARDSFPGRDDLLRSIDALLRKGRIRPAIVAGMFAEAGEEERALEWLERARAEKDLSLLLVRLDDRWTRLHADPRFRAILADVGPRAR
ncbi:MAG TPA: winged helix-turn-helix domain-containing protein [Thermoanaerobaculia bacterium]|nr:winged helix-turn-helix domain-containing protein [Thermoanaerobaculia bacterium]